MGHAKVRPGTRVATRTEEEVDDKKSPDCQLRFMSKRSPRPELPYHFKGSRFPQFVIEIGYSEKSRALQSLAKDYYEKSQGAIKTVLTVDIEYVSASGRRHAGSGAGQTTPPSLL
jgi:hypothetical protein